MDAIEQEPVTSSEPSRIADEVNALLLKEETPEGLTTEENARLTHAQRVVVDAFFELDPGEDLTTVESALTEHAFQADEEAERSYKRAKKAVRRAKRELERARMRRWDARRAVVYAIAHVMADHPEAFVTFVRGPNAGLS